MFLFYIIQSGQINIEIEDIDILVYSIAIVQTLCEFIMQRSNKKAKDFDSIHRYKRNK